MKTQHTTTFLALLGISCGSAPLEGTPGVQVSINTGDFTLDGMVKRISDGNALNGLAVQLKLLDCKTSPCSATDTTDGSGRYQFAGVPSGQYTLSTEKDGYDDYSASINLGRADKIHDIAMIKSGLRLVRPFEIVSSEVTYRQSSSSNSVCTATVEGTVSTDYGEVTYARFTETARHARLYYNFCGIYNLTGHGEFEFPIRYRITYVCTGGSGKFCVARSDKKPECRGGPGGDSQGFTTRDCNDVGGIWWYGSLPRHSI